MGRAFSPHRTVPNRTKLNQKLKNGICQRASGRAAAAHGGEARAQRLTVRWETPTWQTA